MHWLIKIDKPGTWQKYSEIEKFKFYQKIQKESVTLKSWKHNFIHYKLLQNLLSDPRGGCFVPETGKIWQMTKISVNLFLKVSKNRDIKKLQTIPLQLKTMH